MKFYIQVLGTIFYSVNDVLWKKIMETSNLSSAIFFRNLTTLAFLLIAYGFYQDQDYLPKNVETRDWIIAFGLCSFSYFGLYFFSKAMQYGEVSHVTPIVNISVFFGVLVSVFVLHEIAFIKIWPAYFAIAGVFIMEKVSLSKTFRLSKAGMYALLCAFVWGVSYSLFSVYVKKFNPILFSIILEVSFLLMNVIFTKAWLQLNIKKIPIKLILISGLIVAMGSISVSLSYQLYSSYQFILLTTLSPVISVILAILIYKEKITWQKTIGILVIILSLMANKLLNG